MKSAPTSDQNAFTLVEVFFAAGLMLVGVVGMIQALTIGSEMLDVARKQTLAEQIIQSEIDKVRMNSWTTINALPASATITINTSLQTVCAGFTCTRTATNVKTDMLKVKFTVTWTGNTGRSYTRSGETYLGKNGLHVSYQRS